MAAVQGEYGAVACVTAGPDATYCLVRYCWPVWRSVVSAYCGTLISKAHQEALKRQLQGEAVAIIDWLLLYTNFRRMQFGQVTSAACNRVASTTREEPIQNASRLQLVVTSVRGAFISSTTRLRSLYDMTFTTSVRMVVLMTGLDAAGKTSILYKHTRGEIAFLLLGLMWRLIRINASTLRVGILLRQGSAHFGGTFTAKWWPRLWRLMHPIDTHA